MKKEISNLSQITYIREYTITSNSEKGVDVIELVNENYRVLLNKTKALDIMQMYYKGMNLCFISKNGFSTRTDHFLKRFEGGMLYTVGLDTAGDRPGFEFHGTLHHLIPNVYVTRCDEEEIVVEASLKDGALFGKNLVLYRKYVLTKNGLTLEDRLVNEGTIDEEYCMLYHNNLGYPLLDKGCLIEADFDSINPRTEWAKQHVQDIKNVSEAIDNQFEYCYFTKLKKNDVSLINKEKKIKFNFSYTSDDLNNFILWESMKTQDYAVGFEPSTTLLDDKFKLSPIKAKESKLNKFTYKVIEL